MAIVQDTYAQRARMMLKLLDPYLHPSQGWLTDSELARTKVLPILVRADLQQAIAAFLGTHFKCHVRHGKDRYGQPNGYLMVSLDNGRINQTSCYQAAIALNKIYAAWCTAGTEGCP